MSSLVFYIVSVLRLFIRWEVLPRSYSLYPEHEIQHMEHPHAKQDYPTDRNGVHHDKSYGHCDSHDHHNADLCVPGRATALDGTC